jgi:uncharacterized membrane protein
MDLSPDERKQIYEEEKSRLESETATDASGDTSLNIEPKVAALLCYLGLWITGIIFLVLEPKNRYVRFHAVQSIIVFGFFMVAGALLGQIPYAGIFFGIIFSIITLVFWIVMMVKAYEGEAYRVPVAGNMAAQIVGETGINVSGQPESTVDHETPAAESPETESPLAAKPVAVQSPPSPPSVTTARDDRHTGRPGRITASAFVIAWSIVFLIFFNYFNQYIALYRLDTGNGTTHWMAYPIITGEFQLWLPTITAVLFISIVGHIILIAFDNYILRESVSIVINIFSIVAVATLLSLFPFDFSHYPHTLAADIGPILTTLALVGIIIGIGIATLVGFIKLLVNIATRNYPY